MENVLSFFPFDMFGSISSYLFILFVVVLVKYQLFLRVSYTYVDTVVVRDTAFWYFDLSSTWVHFPKELFTRCLWMLFMV